MFDEIPRSYFKSSSVIYVRQAPSMVALPKILGKN